MSVQFLGPDVLFRGDQVAMDPDCCCSSSSSEGDCGPVLGDVPSEITFSVEGVEPGTSCECGSGSGDGGGEAGCDCDSLHNVDVIGEDQGKRDDEYCSPPLPAWPGTEENPYPFNGWPECCRIWTGAYYPGEEIPSLLCDYSPDWPPGQSGTHNVIVAWGTFALEAYFSKRFQTRWLRLLGGWRYGWATGGSPEVNMYYDIGFLFQWEEHDEPNGSKPWTWDMIEERLTALPIVGGDAWYWKYTGSGTPYDPEIPPWCNFDSAIISVRASQ